MSLLSRLVGKSSDPRAEVRPLWHRVVEIAREKPWYAQFGVADTVAGRFDAVTLVLALVMLRMERDSALITPSVHLTELFVDDMDGQLRQSGVGDLVVGKRMGKLMSVLGGRIGALREALPQGGAALAEVLGRNVTLIEGADRLALAAHVKALALQLDAVSDPDLMNASIAR
ncbi:cytochrome b pre-mRNA-processing protein 3 [Novosphingobium sp. PhB57]|uniref:ubiquinol-cytochrome C chaperone family protein n=1 Tax=Novosphingobium sp. PhB57 TaxID=2485107 RepID=UPI00104421A9|nr:ubiquinol-cytochrome C chaperone family protein [Novosphingobium sp. PhB57]TCU52233.1 cytochrome b pre-mRNA-processing protein 3 [Novosphingobium sp. PhB57]